MTAPSPAGLSPLLDQLDVRVSPDRKLVALRGSDTEPRWRVSNGGHYRDRDVHGWPSLTAVIRAVEAECDALDDDADGADDFARDWKRLPEGRDRLRALADERRAAATRIRNVLTAALTPGADTAGATA